MFPEEEEERKGKASLLRRSKSVIGTAETSRREEELDRSTPTSPKRVHFADANGQSLVEIKNFVSSDQSGFLGTRKPIINRRQSDPLVFQCKEIKSQPGKLVLPCFTLKPCFQLPSIKELEESVARHSVCLQNVVIDARMLKIVCRVKNISFSKSVSVRFTFDGWKSFTDLNASHVQHSMDGKTDKFEARIHVPKRIREVAFAIRYQVDGKEFWDSNNSKNYIVQSSV